MEYVDLTDLFIAGNNDNEDIIRGLTYSEVDSPIKGLKSIVLSLDWEISDTTLGSLNRELESLEAEWNDDKDLVTLLKILGALGKYIHKKKAQAHPDAIKLLNSSYSTLEKISLSPQMSQEARKDLAAEETRRFYQLKKQISSPAEKKEEQEPSAAPGISEEKTDVDAVFVKLGEIAASVDFGVTAQTATQLKGQIAALARVWGTDRNLSVFLQLLQTIANYFDENKEASHPESGPLFQEVVEQFEKAALTPGLTSREKSEMVVVAVRRFKEFKNRRATLTTAPVESPAAVAEGAAGVQTEAVSADVGKPEESLAPQALEDVYSSDSLEFISSDQDVVVEAMACDDIPGLHPAAANQPGSSAPVNPFDDLFQAPPSSPVDDQLNAIHLALFTEGSDAPEEGVFPRERLPGVDEDSRVIEVRTKTEEAIPDIEQRLHEFFGDDPAAVDQAPGEAGVVPYLFDELQPLVQDEAQQVAAGTTPKRMLAEIVVPLPAETEQDLSALSRQTDEDFSRVAETLIPAEQPVSGNLSDLFEKDVEAMEKVEARPQVQAGEADFQKLLSLTAVADTAIDAQTIAECQQALVALREVWPDFPERLLLLRLIESVLRSSAAFGEKSPPDFRELLAYLSRSEEKILQLSDADDPLMRIVLFDCFNRFIDFQNSSQELLRKSIEKAESRPAEVAPAGVLKPAKVEPPAEPPPAEPVEAVPSRSDARKPESKSNGEKIGFLERIKNLFR